MQASPACLNLIKRSEGLALIAYRCPAGRLTIGYGRAHGVTEGMTVTPTEAEALLLEDVRATEAELRPMLAGIEVTQGMWDALVSLAFNVGARALPKKAPKLWAALKSGDRAAAAHVFLDMDKAKDPATGKMVPLPGLTARRRAEADLFLRT